MQLKDILNSNNIRDFVGGNYLMWKDQLTNKGIPYYVKEQALYRAILCRPCLVKGKCLICECRTPNMFFSKNKVDSGGKWGKMLDVENWEAFKKEKGIEKLPDSFELIKNIEDGRHTG